MLPLWISFSLGPRNVRSVSHSVMSDSLQPDRLKLPRFLHPWHSPGKNTGMGCHFLLQRIFLTQGSNLGLLHCRQTLPSEHQDSSTRVRTEDQRCSDKVHKRPSSPAVERGASKRAREDSDRKLILETF